MDAGDGKAVEALEQPPAPGADGERTLAEIGPQLGEDELGQPAARAFQVEHQFCAGVGRLEELSQEERATPRRGELPAIPVQRQRADRLQVADLGAAAKESDVGLYQRSTGPLGVTEKVKLIARPVCDDQRRGSV